MIECYSSEKTFLFSKGEIILDSWPSATSCTLQPSYSFVLSLVHSCHSSTHLPTHLSIHVSTHSPPVHPSTCSLIHLSTYPTMHPPTHSLARPPIHPPPTHPPSRPSILFLSTPAATMPRVLAAASLPLVPSALRAESPGAWGWEGRLLLWSLEIPPPREAEAVPPVRGSCLGASPQTLALLTGPLALGAT